MAGLINLEKPWKKKHFTEFQVFLKSSWVGVAKNLAAAWSPLFFYWRLKYLHMGHKYI